MEITLVAWWLLLLFSCAQLAFGEEVVDWDKLKKELNNSNSDSVAKVIANSWSKRPMDFFQGLEEGAWHKVAKRLSAYQISKIRPEEYESMIPEVVKNILYWSEACPTYNVAFWSEERIQHISRECLHGILVQNQAPVKLNKLWQKVNCGILWRFDVRMKLSLRNIDHGDLYFMQPSILKIVLPSVPEACSTLGAAFWTEERMEAISTECLHMILTEREVPVRLGRLWEKVNFAVLAGFTDKMKPALQNVHLDDFYFMQPDTLAVASSIPGICCALGVEFWSEKTIKSISGECLYELFTKHGKLAQLGSLWEDVSVNSCQSLLGMMDFSLEAAHPADRALVRDWVGRAIKSKPLICETLKISFWGKETVGLMTSDCLYRTINESRKPVALGGLWSYIDPLALTGFENFMANRLGNIAGTDFYYMPSDLLQAVLSSEQALGHLPQPSSGVVLSAGATSQVSINSVQFAKLLRLAPSVAGQLLWHSTRLADNVLSDCEGNDIYELEMTALGGIQLDWKDLFARLEEKYRLDGRAQSFAKMVQSISEDASLHFCATLSDPEEYLALAWLHSNLGDKCRSVLPFDPEHASRLFKDLDDAKEERYWEKMLGVYGNSEWNLLSRSKRVVALLGKDCRFWSTIETGGWLSVFDALDGSMLREIALECLEKMPGILANSPERIRHLADDAFSKHAADQLPCHLNRLSPGQIALVSSEMFNSADKLNTEKISQHVLSRVVLDDLKALNLHQFKSLYESQWLFVPGSIKEDALNWQLDSALSRVLDSASNVKSKGLDYNGGANNHFKTIEDTLSIVLEIYKDGHQTIPNSGLVSFFDFIRRDSDLRGTFIEIFEQSKSLGPATVSLVRSVQELRDCNHKAFEKSNAGKKKILLPDGQQPGFDRPAIIKLLSKSPELFAAPRARLSTERIIDTGGAIRALVDQLLSDIARDLVVGCTKVVCSAKKESVRKTAFKADDNTDIMDTGSSKADRVEGTDPGLLQIDNIKISNPTFAWAISKEAGLIVGLALGKALQLDIKLPFKLDSGFYELLIDTSDRAIEAYYKSTYSQEVARYKRNIHGLFKTGDLGTPLSIIPRMDSLCFRGLSTKTSAEEAKQDAETRANLWACSSDDCYTDIKELEGEGFMEKYIEAVLEKTQKEFKEFVRELVRGLGMALPLVTGFDSLPVLVLRPFVEYLPGLLDAEPVNRANLIQSLLFNEDSQVRSLVGGQKVLASHVLYEFLFSLEEKQLEHLIGIWTGSSTLLLNYSELRVTFMSPRNVASYQVDFCIEPSLTRYKHDGFIASGKEYKQFFKRFSRNLLGYAMDVELYCKAEKPDMIPAMVRVCSKDLVIYLQSVEGMLNSLVDLLRTPLTTLWDNQ